MRRCCITTHAGNLACCLLVFSLVTAPSRHPVKRAGVRDRKSEWYQDGIMPLGIGIVLGGRYLMVLRRSMLRLAMSRHHVKSKCRYYVSIANTQFNVLTDGCLFNRQVQEGGRLLRRTVVPKLHSAHLPVACAILNADRCSVLEKFRDQQLWQQIGSWFVERESKNMNPSVVGHANVDVENVVVAGPSR